MYYLAFVKKGFHVFYVDKLQDNCNFGQTNYNSVSAGCPDEVTLQLISALLVNMFIGQSKEVAIPWIISKVKLYLLLRNDEIEKEDVAIWERDSKKADYEGTLDEYSEIVIQYGYITLFAATFPIAPLLAVLNNIVEIRTDAFKLLTSYPRPRYRGAQNIGTWYNILEFLGIIAVMTNTALIGLSFEVIRQAAGNNDYATLGIIIFMEHVILALKFGIAYLIPDLPGWIVKKLAYQEYIKEQTLKTVLLKNHIKPVFEVAEDSSSDEEISPKEEKKMDEGEVTVSLSVEESNKIE